jgi:hypothetical protein
VGKQLTQKALFCEQEGYAPMEGGCQLRKCLDAAVLEMMYREKATADVAFKYLFLRYRQNLLDWVKKNGCEQADEAQDIVHTVLLSFTSRRAFTPFNFSVLLFKRICAGQ